MIENIKEWFNNERQFCVFYDYQCHYNVMFEVNSFRSHLEERNEKHNSDVEKRKFINSPYNNSFEDENTLNKIDTF